MEMKLLGYESAEFTTATSTVKGIRAFFFSEYPIPSDKGFGKRCHVSSVWIGNRVKENSDDLIIGENYEIYYDQWGKVKRIVLA